MTSSFKKQLWISFGIVFGSMIAGGIAVYFLSGDITAQADKIVNDNTLIARQAAAVSILAALKSAAPQAAVYSDALNKLLPDHDELIGFDAWVVADGQTHNVSVSFSFAGNNTPATPTTPGVDGFNLQATGSSDSLIAFLHDIESNAPGFLLSIDSFGITENNPNYTLTASGRLFSQ